MRSHTRLGLSLDTFVKLVGVTTVLYVVCTVFVIYCASTLHVFQWSFDAQ